MSNLDSNPTAALVSQSNVAEPFAQNLQRSHREVLASKWSISPHSQVLEIGCGQGDCTEVLARAVGSEGHVDAVDPAPLDYGSPETLGDAQARISRTEIGPQITWHQASPIDFLVQTDEKAYDAVVLCHSLWYFASPSEISKTLVALKGKAAKLCIAEYALAASEADAVPHVLSALTRASLEAHNPDSDENIRTALAPNAIQAIAEAAGWTLEYEENLVPQGLEDGVWETNTVVSPNFLLEVEKNIQDEKIKVVLSSMREAVKSAVQSLGKRNVKTMDVWLATFK